MTILIPTQFDTYLPQVGADPSQVLARFYEPRLYEEPEELLMRAILEDLINILLGGGRNTLNDGRHDKKYAEAVRDLMSDKIEPFTPAFCFQHYGIDIEAARKALLEGNVSPIIKRRRLNPETDRLKLKRNMTRRPRERRWAQDRRERARQ